MKAAIEIEMKVLRHRRGELVADSCHQDCCKSHCLDGEEQVYKREEAVVADSLGEFAYLLVR